MYLHVCAVEIQMHITFIWQRGGLVCEDCQKKDIQLKGHYPVKLSADARYALQYIISSPFEKLYSFNLSDSVMAEVDGFVEKYLARYLPHHFKSEEFLRI